MAISMAVTMDSLILNKVDIFTYEKQTDSENLVFDNNANTNAQDLSNTINDDAINNGDIIVDDNNVDSQSDKVIDNNDSNSQDSQPNNTIDSNNLNSQDSNLMMLLIM